MHNLKTKALAAALAEKEILSDLKRMDHGGPYDRGTADSYYMRVAKPHFYPNGTYNNPLVIEEFMTTKQIQEYHQGYNDNEKDGFFKDWG